MQNSKFTQSANCSETLILGFMVSHLEMPSYIMTKLTTKPTASTASKDLNRRN